MSFINKYSINTNGQIVLKQNIDKTINSVNVENLAKGVYNFSLQTEEKTLVGKFIKK